MVDNNDFSDLGAVVVDDFSDLGGVPVEAEAIESVAPSKTESFVGGIQSGALLGMDDEVAGTMNPIMDVGMRIGNALGLSGPSPTQVNKELATQGFTGDLGPEGLLEAYRQARNEERVKQKQLSEANPYSYGAGALVGGVATAPLLPAGKVAKDATLGQKVLSGAKAGVAAGTAAGYGMSEADMTQPDIQALKDLGKDMLFGGTAGAVIGGAVPVLIEGIKAGANGVGKVIPDSVKTAFKFGKKGQSVDDALYNQTAEQLDDVSTEVAKPIIAKAESQATDKATRIKELNSEIARLNDEIKAAVAAKNENAARVYNQAKITLEDEIVNLKRVGSEAVERSKDIAKSQSQADISNIEHQLLKAQESVDETVSGLQSRSDAAYAKSKDLAKQKQIADKLDLENKLTSAEKTAQELADTTNQRALAENAQDIAYNTKRNVELGKKLQSEVDDIFTRTSKQYKAIDDAAEKAGVLPDNREAISMMEEVLDPARMNKYKKYFGDNTMANFRLVKGMLQDDMRSIDPNVRQAARNAYGSLKNSFRADLDSNGLQALGQQLDDANNTYMRALDFEDMFLSDVGVDKVTKSQELKKKTLQTMKAFGKADEDAINTTEEFTKRLQGLDPELAKRMLPQIQEAASTTNILKSGVPKVEPNTKAADAIRQSISDNVLPDIPQLPDPRIAQAQAAGNSEVTRLQDLLKAAKGNKPSVPELVDPRIAQKEAQLSQLKMNPPAREVAPSSDPRLLQLQDMLETVRGKDTSRIARPDGGSLDIPTSDLTTARNAIETTFMGSGKYNPKVDNKMNRVVQFLEQELGKQKTDELMTQVPELIENVDMFRALGKDYGPELLGRGGIINKTMIPAANLAGRVVGPVQNFGSKISNVTQKGLDKVTPNFVDELMPSLSAEGSKTKSAISNIGSKVFLTNGAYELNDSSDEGLESLATQIETHSPEGKAFANVLRGIIGKNEVSRAALIMGLMQRPEFRKILKDMSDGEGNEN